MELERVKKKRRMSIKPIREESLSGLSNKDKEQKKALVEKVMHNFEVTTAKGMYAQKKAKSKAHQSIKTLTSARAVARGFESQVAQMNLKITERLEEIVLAEKMKSKRVEHQMREKLKLREQRIKEMVEGKQFNFATSNPERAARRRSHGSTVTLSQKPESRNSAFGMTLNPQQTLKHKRDMHHLEHGHNEATCKVCIRRNQVSTSIKKLPSLNNNRLLRKPNSSLDVLKDDKDSLSNLNNIARSRTRQSLHHDSMLSFNNGNIHFKSVHEEKAHVRKLHFNESKCHRENCQGCLHGHKEHNWPDTAKTRKLKLQKIQPLDRSSRLLIQKYATGKPTR